jgi:hypothetical protein
MVKLIKNLKLPLFIRIARIYMESIRNLTRLIVSRKSDEYNYQDSSDFIQVENTAIVFRTFRY